jgi:hypothetical protein
MTNDGKWFEDRRPRLIVSRDAKGLGANPRRGSIFGVASMPIADRPLLPGQLARRRGASVLMEVLR